jgi:hypothetical protein
VLPETPRRGPSRCHRTTKPRGDITRGLLPREALITKLTTFRAGRANTCYQLCILATPATHTFLSIYNSCDITGTFLPGPNTVDGSSGPHKSVHARGKLAGTCVCMEAHWLVAGSGAGTLCRCSPRPLCSRRSPGRVRWFGRMGSAPLSTLLVAPGLRWGYRNWSG